MARKGFVFLGMGMMIFFFASLASAGVPHMINYQGKLTAAYYPVHLGGCLNDTVQMIFSIYPDTLGSPADWTETQTEVVVKDGIFSVLLGAVDTIPQAVFDGNVKYLGVQVESDPEMRPLKPMVSVAYAYRAGTADGSSGDDGDWAFRITDTADTTLITGGAWGIARYGNTLYGNADSTHVNLGVACTTGLSGYSHKYCTIGGGWFNAALWNYVTVGGGAWNRAEYDCATVGGGCANTASGQRATVGGGGGNTADYQYSTVAGGSGNFAGGGRSSIGGGQDNTASSGFSTIGGGSNNTASNDYATIGGGRSNTGNGYVSTIGGGWENSASGYCATVTGGRNNTASGDYATVAGRWCAARDDYCFAAGNRAKANHAGSVVIAASSYSSDSDSVQSGGDEQMVFRADSGIYITNTSGLAAYDGNKLINTSSGAYLTISGVWTDASDRNSKENFTAVDGKELLKKIATLPITQWNYKVDSDEIKHIGPVAQDFYGIFGLGYDDKTISGHDLASIALVAIQELANSSQKRKAEIGQLEAEVVELQEIVELILAERQKQGNGQNTQSGMKR
jgi:hypothetical protein